MSEHFHDFIYEDVDLQSAWERLVEDEREAFHYGERWGTREFTVTHTVRPHPTIIEPVPEDEAQDLLSLRAEALEPGEAEGIPVFLVNGPQFKHHGELRLMVPVNPSRVEDPDYMREQILQVIPEDWFEQLGRRAKTWEDRPEHLSAENILSWFPNLESPHQHDTLMSTVALEPKRKIATRYVLVNLTTGLPLLPLAWDNSFETAQQALAAAPTEVTSHQEINPPEESYGVVGVVMHDDGSPLAVRTLRSSRAVLSLSVSIGYQVRGRVITDERGWLIHGRS